MNFTCKSLYLPEKNVLVVESDISNFLIDYYIHLKNSNQKPSVEKDDKLKELFSCLACHLCIRPPEETVAFTLHMHAEQPYSLFASGSAKQEFIVGHVIEENIRHTDINMFHVQTIKAGNSYTSAVRCETEEIKEMFESYYKQSEQLPAKIFFIKNSDKAIAIAAMPDYDQEWFDSIGSQYPSEEIEKLNQSPMRTYVFNYKCDCSPEKLLPYFKTLNEEKIDELYGEDSELIIGCPRCGRKFAMGREILSSTEDTE